MNNFPSLVTTNFLCLYMEENKDHPFHITLTYSDKSEFVCLPNLQMRVSIQNTYHFLIIKCGP